MKRTLETWGRMLQYSAQFAVLYLVVSTLISLQAWAASDGPHPVELALQLAYGEHSTPPTSIDFFPDGELLVNSGQWGDIKIWEIATGRVVRTIRPGRGEIFQVSVVDGGQNVRAINIDGTIADWCVDTGLEVRNSIERRSMISVAALATSSTVLAIAGTVQDDATGVDADVIEIWDQGHLVKEATFNLDLPATELMAVSSDGLLVCVVTKSAESETSTAEIWSIAASERIRTIDVVGDMSSVGFDSASRNLLVSTGAPNLTAWSVESGEQNWSTTDFVAEPKIMFIQPTCAVIADGSQLVFVNTSSGHPESKLAVHGDSVACVAYDKKELLMAIALNRNKRDNSVIDVRRADSGAWIRELSGYDEGVTGLAYAPDGEHIYSTSVDGRVRMWDPRTGILQKTMKGHSSAVRGIAISSDGATIATCSWSDGLGSCQSGEVILWDAHTGEMQNVLLHLKEVSSVAFSRSGKYFAAGGNDGSIRVWSVPEWDTTISFEDTVNPIVEQRISTLLFSNNGQRIIYAQKLRGITVRDVVSGDVVWRGQDGASPKGVAISADDHLLAVTGQKAGLVDVITLESGVVERQIQHGYDDATVLAFVPETHTVVVGTLSGNSVVFDADTGDVLHSFPPKEARITSIAFGADAKTVAIGSDDNSFGILSAQLGQTLATFNSPLYTSEFLTCTTDSYFVASPAGEQLVYFRQGRRVDVAAQFHPTLYNPDYVTNSLGSVK